MCPTGPLSSSSTMEHLSGDLLVNGMRLNQTLFGWSETQPCESQSGIQQFLTTAGKKRATLSAAQLPRCC